MSRNSPTSQSRTRALVTAAAVTLAGGLLLFGCDAPPPGYAQFKRCQDQAESTGIPAPFLTTGDLTSLVQCAPLTDAERRDVAALANRYGY